DDLEDKVDLAVQHVAFAHFGQSGDVLLERAQIAFGLALQADHGEDHDREAEAGRVEIGVVAADHARFLQRTHAAQARRSGEPDPARQIDVGDAPFRLEFSQQPAVYAVERRHSAPVTILLLEIIGRVLSRRSQYYCLWPQLSRFATRDPEPVLLAVQRAMAGSHQEACAPYRRRTNAFRRSSRDRAAHSRARRDRRADAVPAVARPAWQHARTAAERMDRGRVSAAGRAGRCNTGGGTIRDPARARPAAAQPRARRLAGAARAAYCSGGNGHRAVERARLALPDPSSADDRARVPASSPRSATGRARSAGASGRARSGAAGT